MEHTKFCQSCGMPLRTPEVHGTCAAGEKSEDYCIYCYQNGAFTLSLIHISEPTRLGMISYAVFCLKKKKRTK